MLRKNGFSLPVLLVIGAIVVFTLGGIFLVAKKPDINYSTNNLTNHTNSKTKAKSNAQPWIPASKNPWPMLHGNYNHIGYAAVSGPKQNNLKWKFLAGNIKGRWPNSMAIAQDGTIYLAGENKLFAITKDGKEKWSKNYSGSQGPAISDDGTVYFVAENSIVALDPTGKEKWRFQTGGNTIFGPTIGPDGTIYQGSWDHYFYALAADGTLRWKYQTNGAISYPSSIGSDGTIYLGGGDAHAGPDSNVYAFDSSGRLKWKYDTKMTRVGSPALAPDGLLYLPAAPSLLVVDSIGNLQWQKGPNVFNNNQQVKGTSTSLAEALGPPPGQNNNSYQSQNPQQGSYGQQGQSQNGQMQGHNQDKGDIAGIITPAISPDGTICIGTSEGKILNIDSSSEEVKWIYKSGAASSGENAYGLPSFPVIDKDGTCYQGSVDGYMYALDKDGKLKWKFQTQGPITEASEAIGPDGTLYFTSEDGYLYAISD